MDLSISNDQKNMGLNYIENVGSEATKALTMVLGQ